MPINLYTRNRKLTPEQQKDWEKKLVEYAYIVSISGEILLGIDKLVKEKVTGKPLAVMDSLIRSIYAGLQKVYSMLKDAYDQVKAGKWPDFTSEVPFPKPLPNLPSSKSDMPNWFVLAWKTIEDALNLLAQRSSKLAEFLPAIEAAGDELVKDLTHYFPPSNEVTLTSFPAFPLPITWSK